MDFEGNTKFQGYGASLGPTETPRGCLTPSPWRSGEPADPVPDSKSWDQPDHGSTEARRVLLSTSHREPVMGAPRSVPWVSSPGKAVCSSEGHSEPSDPLSLFALAARKLRQKVSPYLTCALDLLACFFFFFNPGT